MATTDGTKERVEVGDVVVWEHDNHAQVIDKTWARALNGVDRDSYRAYSVYRTPLFRRVPR